MESKKFKYDFFISYKHGDPDSEIASYIQHLLEHYSIPKEIQEKCGKTKIARVFRDESELSASSDLTKDIREQLENSEYLIVICSPNTRNSRWVTQEINTFMEVRDAFHILPVLIEGEPQDSFPEILLQTEPMAADFRGKTKKDIRRQCQSEILRLIAPALHCSYDELKQRHKTYQMRKFLIIASIIAVLACLFGSYSVYQSIQIAQNLRTKQINQSKLLAEQSSTLLENGDRESALLVAMEALPSSEQDTSKPLVGEAQISLQKALSLYTLEETEGFFANRILQMRDSSTEIYDLNTENRILATCDSQDIIYFWDLDTNTLLSTLNLHEKNMKCTDVFLNTSSQAFICITDRIICFDYQTSSVVWEWVPEGNHYFENYSLSPDKSTIAVGHSTDIEQEDFTLHSALAITLIDAKTGTESQKLILEFAENPFSLYVKDLVWSSDNQRIGINASLTAENLTYLCLADLEKESIDIIKKLEIDHYHLTKLTFSDSDTFIFLQSNSDGITFNYYYTAADYSVSAYDIHTQENLWTIHNSGIYRGGNVQITFSELKSASTVDQVITVVGFSEVVNIVDGTVISESTYGSNIVGIYTNNALQYHITNEGLIHKVNITTNATVNVDYGNMDLEVEDIFFVKLISEDEIFLLQKNSGNIYLFNRKYDSSGIELEDSLASTSQASYDPTGDFILDVLRDYDNRLDTVKLWDSSSGKLLFTETIERGKYESFDQAGFLNSKYFYYASNSRIILYSVDSLEKLSTYTCEDPEETYFALYRINSTQICDTDTPCIYFVSADDEITKLTGESLDVSVTISQAKLQEIFSFEPASEMDTLSHSEFNFLPSPNGRYIALYLYTEEDTTKKHPVYLFDCETNALVEIPEIAVHQSFLTMNYAFSEDSSKLMIYDMSKQLHVIDIATGTVEKVFELDGDSYHAFWLSPDNQYLFLHSYDHILTVYDLKKERYTTISDYVSYNITNWKFYEGSDILLIESTPSLAFPIQTLFRRIENGEYEPYASTGCGVDATDKHFLTLTDTLPLHQYDIRSLDEMLEDAKQFLNGRELTELERQKYHLEE